MNLEEIIIGIYLIGSGVILYLVLRNDGGEEQIVVPIVALMWPMFAVIIPFLIGVDYLKSKWRER